jgi:hypothetical protein
MYNSLQLLHALSKYTTTEKAKGEEQVCAVSLSFFIFLERTKQQKNCLAHPQP